MAATPPIYLDANATTPVDPRVLEAMLPYFTEKFGNAASKTHAYGWTAESAVERARTSVATILGAAPASIVFTSGATESNNLAVRGVAEAAPEGKNHVVTTAIEHHAVLDPCRQLERYGFRCTVVPPNENGVVDPAAIAAALTPETCLVSVMLANNEIGTVQPVAEIGALARGAGAVFHTDAAQAVGRVAIDVEAMQVDLLSLSAHKLYGPKGVGALHVRRGTALAPQLLGGGHERGLRSGTPNVPGIVGLGRACELLLEGGAAETERIRALRDRLLAALTRELPGVLVNGILSVEARLAGNLNVSFEGVASDALIGGLPGVAFSSGSACTSATLEPSYVLRALGFSDARARSSVRFGVGRFTTADEIDRAAASVVARVQGLRR